MGLGCPWSALRKLVQFWREPCGAIRMENWMGRQRFTPEQIIAKLREVEVLVGRGATAVEACRQIGIVEQTLSRWRQEYGGLTVDQEIGRAWWRERVGK